jgi:hypothetical protein
MRTKLIFFLAAAFLAGGQLPAAPPEGPTPPARTTPAFERFKALAGDWVAADDGDMSKKGDLVARYHLTGGGSAVVEELFPGTPHEMTTVYHLDGQDVVLTHYCMMGNQPQMRAKPTSSSRVAFAFDGGTNIDPKHDEHMHTVSFDFVGANELRTEWIDFNGGKPEKTAGFHLVRKSS